MGCVVVYALTVVSDPRHKDGSISLHTAIELRLGEVPRKSLPRRNLATMFVDYWADPRCRIGLRMGGAAFAVSVGFLLDALVGHGEVGLPGHAVVVGYLPGRLHDVRPAETCGGAL